MKRRPNPVGETVAEVLAHLLGSLGARWAEEHSPAAPDLDGSSDQPAAGENPTEARLAERAVRAARSLLADLTASRVEEERAVAQVLAAPSPVRWYRSALDPVLQRPQVIERLLAVASTAGPDSPSLDAEEICLLALHLCERLEPEDYPEGLVGDLLCRALALRVEHLIARRKLRAAELAALRTRDLLLESSDPLVASDVGLAAAFLHWAQGEHGAALALLNDLGRLAGGLGEVERAGEVSLWCCLLLLELGEPDAAAELKARADAFLGSAMVRQRWVKIRAKHECLHLGEPTQRHESLRQTVH